MKPFRPIGRVQTLTVRPEARILFRKSFAAFSQAIASFFDCLAEFWERSAETDDRRGDLSNGGGILGLMMTCGSTQIFSVTSPTEKTSAASAASSKVL
jgi:hypothetical protein